MTTNSSVLAWEIPLTEEPGGLQSIGSQSWTRLSTAPPFTNIIPFNIHSHLGVCHPAVPRSGTDNEKLESSFAQGKCQFKQYTTLRKLSYSIWQPELYLNCT